MELQSFIHDSKCLTLSYIPSTCQVSMYMESATEIIKSTALNVSGCLNNSIHCETDFMYLENVDRISSLSSNFLTVVGYQLWYFMCYV